MKLNSSFGKMCIHISIVFVACCLMGSQAHNLDNAFNMNSGAPYGDVRRTNQRSNFGDVVLKVIQKLRQNQKLYSLLSLKSPQTLPSQSDLEQYDRLGDGSKRLRRSVEDDSLQKFGDKNVAPTEALRTTKKDAKLAVGGATGTEIAAESLPVQKPESQIPTPSETGRLQTTSPIKYITELNTKDPNVNKAGGKVDSKAELVQTTLLTGLATVTSDAQQESIEPDNLTLMESTTTPANVYLTPTAATRGQQLEPKTTQHMTFAPKIQKTELKNSDTNFDKNVKDTIGKYNESNLEIVLSGPTLVSTTRNGAAEVRTSVDEDRPEMDINTMTTVKAVNPMSTSNAGDARVVDLIMKTERRDLTTPTPVSSESTDISAIIPNMPKALTEPAVQMRTDSVQTTASPIVTTESPQETVTTLSGVVIKQTNAEQTATGVAETSSSPVAVPTAVTETGKITIVTTKTPVSNSTNMPSTEHSMTEPTVTGIVVRTNPPDTTETLPEQIQTRVTDPTLAKETSAAVIAKTNSEDAILPNSSVIILPKRSPAFSIVPTKSASEELVQEPKRTVRTISDIRTRTVASSESNIFPSLKYIKVTTSVLSPSPTFGITSLPKSFTEDSIVPPTPVVQTITAEGTDSSSVFLPPVQIPKSFEVVQTGDVKTLITLGTIASTTLVGTTTPSGSLLSTVGWISDIKTTPSLVKSSSRSPSDFDTVRTQIFTSSSGIVGSTTLGLSYATSSITSTSQTPPLVSFDGTVIATSRAKTMSTPVELSSTLTPTASSNIFQQTLSFRETLISSNLPSKSANIDSSFTTSSESPSSKTLSPTIPAISPTITVSDSQTIDSSFSQSPKISQTPIIPTSYSASEPLSTPISSPNITASSEITNTHTKPLIPSTPIFTNYLSQITAKLEPSSSSVLKSVITVTQSFSVSDIETTPLASQEVGMSSKYSSTIPGTTSDISPTRTQTLSSHLLESSLQSIRPTVSQSVTVFPTVLPPTVATGTTNEPSTASVTVVTPGVTNKTTSSPSISVSPPSNNTTKTTVSMPSSTTNSPMTESSTTVVPPRSTTRTTQSPPTKRSNTVPPRRTTRTTTSSPNMENSSKTTTKVTTQNTVTVLVNTTDISPPRNETLAKASMSTTTIVGIAVGSIMGFWIILGPIVCFLCRMKDKAKDRRNRPYDVDDPEEGDYFLRDYVATHLARSRPTNFQNQQNDRYSMDVFTHIENGVMKTEL